VHDSSGLGVGSRLGFPNELCEVRNVDSVGTFSCEKATKLIISSTR